MDKYNGRMQTATGYDDFGFVERMMRGHAHRFVTEIPIWSISQPENWIGYRPITLFEACRRRLFRYLLQRFPQSTFESRDIEVCHLPGQWERVGQDYWRIPDPAPIRPLYSGMVSGEWTLWHGERPAVGDVWLKDGWKDLERAILAVDCRMYLQPYPDYEHWMLALRG